MYFLLIETSHSQGSICLYNLEEMVEQCFLDGAFKHAEQLAVKVDELLKKHGLNSRNISAIGVSDGPGSYTGLRIGVSWAKGFCLPNNIPLIACSVTKALKIATQQQTQVLSIIDARRMEVFGEYFKNDESSEGCQAWIIDDSLVTTWKEENPLLVGDAVDKLKEHYPWSWKDSGIRFSNANHLFPEFIQKWKSNQFENIFHYEPNYVKPVHLVPSKK